MEANLSYEILLKQRFTTVESAWDVAKQGERLLKAAKDFHVFDNPDVEIDLEDYHHRERMYSLEIACFLILAKRFVQAYKLDQSPKPTSKLPDEVITLVSGLRDMHEHPEDYELPLKMTIDELIEKKIKDKHVSAVPIIQRLGVNLGMHRATIYDKVTEELSLAGIISVRELLKYANAFLNPETDPYSVLKSN